VTPPGAALDHLMGTSVEARFLGRPVRRHGEVMQVNAHASVRVYYMTRNSLLLARRHFRADPAWTLRRLAEEATAHAIRLGVGPHKGADARAIALGVRDALRSRTGPAPLGLRGAAGPRR
jgi:rhamnosyltransferase